MYSDCHQSRETTPLEQVPILFVVCMSCCSHFSRLDVGHAKQEDHAVHIHCLRAISDEPEGSASFHIFLDLQGIKLVIPVQAWLRACRIWVKTSSLRQYWKFAWRCSLITASRLHVPHAQSQKVLGQYGMCIDRVGETVRGLRLYAGKCIHIYVYIYIYIHTYATTPQKTYHFAVAMHGASNFQHSKHLPQESTTQELRIGNSFPKNQQFKN